VALQLALRSAAEVNTASNYSRQTTVSRSDGWITCQNTTSKTASLALADGSTVVLQPGSSLRYPGRFTGTQRLVTLSGEAFFEVAHDTTRPFRVLTAQLTTTVLGTSFTVRALPGSADAVVMVRTGRVKVSPRPDQFVSPEAARPAPPADVVVLPNQQAVFSQRSGKMRRELVAEPAPLQPAVLRFDERPVAEVLASLEHTYGVPIRYDGAALAGCTVSLAFGQESLFEKLDLLSKALGASYEQVEESIVFRSRGCQSE
jgi:ferric-dicitrate binding protein FerR (iron transport regulator)